jgi:hypothetical protein
VLLLLWFFLGNQSNETNTTQTDYTASSLATAGDLTLTARGSESNTGILPADGSAPKDGNINILGSNISGQNVTLDAANDINIASAQAAGTMRSDNSNASGAVGVAFGVGSGGGGLSIFADASLGKGHENGDSVINQNSAITAADTLTIKSGNDTTVAGATLKGGTVNADIGGDLTMESRQDTDTYEARQQQISGGGSYTIGAGSGEAHASLSLNQTDSDYASVKEQTGIFAGQGGFDINVGGNTSLVGAVIASEADPALNRLSTQTIDFSDIENHSSYDAKSVNINASTSGAPSGGMSHQSDSVTGMTQSAIADGNITVRGDFDENGTQIQDSLANLSRDTANANGSVENIFNPQKIQEQQELAQLAGQVGFRAAGDVGKYFQNQAKDKATEAAAKDAFATLVTTDPEAAQKWLQDNPQAAQQYGLGMDADAMRADANQLRTDSAQLEKVWGDGGIGKITLHTFVGAAQASMGGGDILSGALGAGVAEVARNKNFATQVLGLKHDYVYDDKGNIIGDNNANLLKAVDQLASAGIGLGAGAVAGDAMTGGGAAWSAEQFNRQFHKEEMAELKTQAESKTSNDIAAKILQDNPGMTQEEALALAKSGDYNIKYDHDKLYQANYDNYLLAGSAMVHAGDEITEKHWLHGIMQIMQKNGAGDSLATYRDDLKSTGLFTYDDSFDGVLDMYASGNAKNRVSGFFGGNGYYGNQSIGSITIDGVTYDGNSERFQKLNNQYTENLSNGEYDLLHGFNQIQTGLAYLGDAYHAASKEAKDAQSDRDKYVYDGKYTYKGDPAYQLEKTALLLDAAAKSTPQNSTEGTISTIAGYIPVARGFITNDNEIFKVNLENSLNDAGGQWGTKFADEAKVMHWDRLAAFSKNLQSDWLSLEMGALDFLAPSLTRQAVGLGGDLIGRSSAAAATEGVTVNAAESGLPKVAGSVADNAAAGASKVPDTLFHYTTSENAESILQNGLRPGADGKVYTTSVGDLTPTQAQIDLALRANRGLPDTILEIDTKALQDMGITPSSGPLRVLPTTNAPGSGIEFTFEIKIPPEFIKPVPKAPPGGG